MGTQAVDERGVLAVAAVSDDILRNLRITYAYHQLSTDMVPLLGDRNANWCSFATWASRSVGDTMRLEGVPAFIDLTIGRLPAFDRLRVAFEERVRNRRIDLVRAAPDGKEHRLRDLLHYVCHQLAEGNRIVFLEVGLFWSRFTATFAAGPDDARLVDFLDHVVDDGGKPLIHLRQAFAAYHAAMSEADSKRKAELVLAANCRIGSWEQWRLQDAIAAAVEAPVEELVDEALRDPLDELVPHSTLHRVLERGLNRVEDMLTDVWRDLATEDVMVCQLPDADVALGRDLRAGRGQRLFPADLDPLSLPEAVQVWSLYNRADVDGRRSGASDWLDFGERMNFIVNLFRSRQQDAALLRCPFTDAQLAMLDDGLVPAVGDL
jgi:hypothetical protein